MAFWCSTLEILDPYKAIMESAEKKRKLESEKPWKRSDRMEAREFWKIVKEECETITPYCNDSCRFFDTDGIKHCSCTATPSYRGCKDPVTIAEQIKHEQTKPTPATTFDQGKHYRFSAALYDGELYKQWAKDHDGEEVVLDEWDFGTIDGRYIQAHWCYEVKKPTLPVKLGNDITYGDLVSTTNAIIDYLKARQNND